ncbi:MAG TPA: long-chain fatty acid--CoA ligase [Acidobacteriaceae bacterium]|nr:long-chain fatty acid--CoA ligase [Acidobacteriaceae bacterium]
MTFDLKTLNDVFFRACSAGDERVMQWRDAAGKWQPIMGRELYARVVAFAGALSAWGIVKGDRVALLAENRWEWAVTDFAVMALGAVDVPLYPSLTAQQVAAILADSGARIVVVSSAQQYEKVAALRHLTQIERIVIMDCAPDVTQAVWFGEFMPDPKANPEKFERDSNFDRRAYDVQPEDLATIMYTSGTTGEAKGVMLTHGNIASNLDFSTAAFHWGRQDICISYLPLSHITARHVDYALICHGATIAYCSPFDLLKQAMGEVRPTIFVGVPRVYEKVRQEVMRRAQGSRATSAILHWSLRRGGKNRGTLLAGKTPSNASWKLANRLVFRKIQQGFGGRVGTFISGGAPLGLETAGWFLDAGIRIQEGYGLTETSPVVALNTHLPCRLGSVGQLLPNVEAKLAADGELLLRGPSVFQGYWNKPEANAESFDAEGWFLTGDIARFDDDGFLYITDRKKDLLKTSGGKLIAPQPIENQLKADPLVANAAVVGDKRKFASVIISPNFPVLEAWAKEKGIDLESRQQLVAHPEVRALYQQVVERVNASLASFETLKRIHVVADEWTIDSGEMTPSMKLKRPVVVGRYAKEIDRFYHEEDVSLRP